MQNYKKVALKLHGLSQSDQQWLLAKLPLQHRKGLRGLLNELEELGIPRENTLVEDWEPSNEKNAVSVSDQEDNKAIDELSNANAQQLSSLCKEEPDELVAALLGMRDWSWKEDVLASLHETRRHSIRTIMNKSQLKISELTANSLCESVLLHLHLTPPRVESANQIEQLVPDFNKRGRRKFGWLPWRR